MTLQLRQYVGLTVTTGRPSPHPLAVPRGTRHAHAQLEASVRVVLTRDAAIATVAIEGVEFAGTSKRAPGERHDPEAGGRLAIARALRAAADAYERAAGVTPYEATVAVELAPGAESSSLSAPARFLAAVRRAASTGGDR